MDCNSVTFTEVSINKRLFIIYNPNEINFIRSSGKQTYPGMFDNMVAGGISCGYGVKETLIKECAEEAGIPEELATKSIAVGIIR